MKNKDIVKWLFVAALLGAFAVWNGSPKKSNKEQSCAERLAEYKDVSMRIMGIASNVQPQDQISFNEEIDRFRSQMSRCSTKEKEHIKQASRAYNAVLSSYAQDVLSEISENRYGGQEFSFNPSEETEALIQNLEQYTPDPELLGAVSGISKMLVAVFSKYDELTDTRKNLVEAQIGQLLTISNNRTEKAFSRLFNEN